MTNAPSTGDTRWPDRGRRRGARRRADREMVPPAEFSSYYGRPILKEPTWKVPDVPAYLFLGGMAGASATMAGLADATDRPALRRVGRLAAASGAMASVGFLIHDLGRPERFLNMLRVVKPTSPLSVGSWILSPFSSLAAAAALSELTGLLPIPGRLAGAGAALVGPAMTTYTAVLLADTAAPGWHDAHRELPYIFAGSALASAGGVGMLAAPVEQAGPARRMTVLGAALELAASKKAEGSLGLANETWEQGRPGLLLTASKALAVASAVGAVAGRRSRWISAAAGACAVAGGLATRFGIFEAGVASTRDPKYVVVPQRERLDARNS